MEILNQYDWASEGVDLLMCVYNGHILLSSSLLLVNIFDSCPYAQRPWQDKHFINLINK